MKLKVFTIMIISTFLLTDLKIGAVSSGWYCIRQTEHKRPPIPPEYSYITEYGGKYIGKDDKTVYLTFDAGYENGNVEKILDILKEEGITAAFFVLEHTVKDYTGLVNRMFDEGHLVCNHTSNHPDLTKCGCEKISEEIESLEDLCLECTGRQMSRYFRPPEGKINLEILKTAEELGYKTVFWSFAYADWDNDNQMNPEKALKKVLDNVHNGEVILLHPTSSTNVRILTDVIKSLKADGYRFGTLDELYAE